MENKFKYSNNNKRYHTLDYENHQKHHGKVCKISLNTSFSCPNRDQNGNGGCIYCSKLKSGEFAGNQHESLEEQFTKISKMMHQKWPNAKQIAYFQAGTNTYAPIDRLKETFEPFVEREDIVAISIATRPDAITEECYRYLDSINQRKHLMVELGLQTIHERTSKLIHRGHDLVCFENAVKKLRALQIEVVVHIINGLPYESKQDMIETVQYVNTLNIQGIKIHMLHILKDTPLATLYEKQPFHVLSREEYVDIVVTQLEYLNEEIVIHRITGDPKKEELIAPTWLLKKFCVLNEIDKEMVKRNIYQGDKIIKAQK